MDWIRFNLAAVNRKVEGKIGFNKQKGVGVGGGPQQEIIIWAIVGFVKGLAWMKIGQDALLYPRFLCNTLSALISDKSGSLGWRNVFVLCVKGAKTHVTEAEPGTGGGALW